MDTNTKEMIYFKTPDGAGMAFGSTYLFSVLSRLWPEYDLVDVMVLSDGVRLVPLSIPLILIQLSLIRAFLGMSTHIFWLNLLVVISFAFIRFLREKGRIYSRLTRISGRVLKHRIAIWIVLAMQSILLIALSEVYMHAMYIATIILTVLLVRHDLNAQDRRAERMFEKSGWVIRPNETSLIFAYKHLCRLKGIAPEISVDNFVVNKEKLEQVRQHFESSFERHDKE